MSMADCDSLIDALNALKELKQKKYELLTQEQADQYNREILHWLEKGELMNDRIIAEITMPRPTSLVSVRESEKEMQMPRPSQQRSIGAGKRKKYVHQRGLGEERLGRKEKKASRKKQSEKEYTVYHTSLYGKFANRLCHAFTGKLMRAYPHFFSTLYGNIRRADIKMLANTYISMMLLTTILAGCAGIIGGVAIGSIFTESIVFTPIIAVMLGIICAGGMFLIWYVYPATVMGSRNRLIKNDLPFAIIHMAAIAGSGTQPAAMFRLLLNAGEYKGLESDLKKIVNYIHLFGYNLSTALKSVAATTPSKRFRDVLNGIAATIEAGGSLKSYLKSIADDTMNTYRLERKKRTEVLATYSDIYTGILIAAPLLFLVTLAIINTLGGGIGGVSVGAIAMAGTYIGIPALNLVFLLVMNIVQPD